MQFIGVDLAWGERKPSGVAVLDEDGTLLHLSAQSTDQTITQALAPYSAGPCLVAIDAPLVVTNPTGNRPAERALNRDFARFDAGAHPANTSKREFASLPRGARLAASLGLDINPTSGRPRRAIEVYPHPATIVLLGLGRTLKYKNKPGRTVENLRGELHRLMVLLAACEEADTPLRLNGHEGWRALVEGVEGAARKSELRVAEDQVDAVVCAYIARFAQAHPERMTTYGDLDTGYIMTPSLPDGHRPTPRAQPDSGSQAAAPPTKVAPAAPSAGLVQQAVQTYAARHAGLSVATEEWADRITTMLDDAGINYLSVVGRTKSVASFAAKANRTVNGRALYADPLLEITDQIGVRVITYVRSDVAAVADLLGATLTVLDDRDMGVETAREGRFGYSSRHLVLRPDQAPVLQAGTDVDQVVSVQVRTVLQHAWAEFEHDIRYKGTIPQEVAPDLDRRFTLAAGLLELADQELSAIRERLQASMEPHEGDAGDPRLSAQDLAAFLSGQFPDAGWSRTEHYVWISGLLLEIGVASLDELRALLASVDSEAIIVQMGYRYPPGAVRRLDDALLAIFGERYAGLPGNATRIGALRGRLSRLRGRG